MIKNLDEINKLSLGTELLQNLPDEPKVEEVSTINQPTEIEQRVPEKPRRTKEEVLEDMKKGGVEVVDVKAIEKDKKK